MLVSCFHILIELVKDTTSDSSNSNCEIFGFCGKLPGSRCTLVLGAAWKIARSRMVPNQESKEAVASAVLFLAKKPLIAWAE